VNDAFHEAGAGARGPAWVAVDQEGGRVVRVREPLTPIPPMRAVGDKGKAALAAEVAEVIATEISMLGFNLNFSPVLDVDTNPDNPVIGDRSFSRDPEVVAQMGGAFMAGHLTAGVVPCAKHFPGHGDTDTDSHIDLPVVNHAPERLEEIELYPFKRAIDIGFPMIMTAHVMVPALDTVHPATLSHAVMTRLLRQEFDYDGVVVSDCLEMNAVADRYEITEMVELGLRAGVDMFLICHTESKWRAAREHLIKLATNNDIDRHRVFQSANRIMELKTTMLGSWPRPWVRPPFWRDEIGSEQNLAVMKSVTEDIVTGGDDPTETLH
jgi:beta-N-acetylhexosaminidase